MKRLTIAVTAAGLFFAGLSSAVAGEHQSSEELKGPAKIVTSPGHVMKGTGEGLANPDAPVVGVVPGAAVGTGKAVQSIGEGTVETIKAPFGGGK